MKRSSMVKSEASKKGLYTGLAGVGTVAALIFGAPWWLGVAGLGATGYLGVKWLKFRGKWGLRF